MNIPIRNLYYILCYAFDNLEEGKRIEVGQDNFDNTTNLFAKLMISACNHLRSRGFWRSYKESEQELNGIKGKVLFGESLKNNRLMHGKATCLTDEFTIDILSNQIIKATLSFILRADDLNVKYEQDLLKHIKSLDSVSDIRLNSSIFSRTSINRNNQFYRFVLHLCELIFDCWLPDPKVKGKYHMRELLQDEKRMRAIFENFVKNFYAQQDTEFDKVSSETMKWDAIALTEGGSAYLPIMRTDISLTGKERTLIIDTKYYAQALTVSQYGKEVIHSSNLYQLTTYLDHKQKELPHKPEGMLLYPANGKKLRLKYEIKGNLLSICTVDLSQPWEEIENELLALVS